MSSYRKTIRFQDNDVKIYQAIADYKKYGYRSESHLVIEAVKKLIFGDKYDGLSEKVARSVVEQLMPLLSEARPEGNSSLCEKKKDQDNEVYDAVMSFIDSL